MYDTKNTDFAGLCKALGIGYTEYKNMDKCIKEDAKVMFSQITTWCRVGSGIFFPFGQALINMQTSVPEQTLRYIDTDIYVNRLIYELKQLGVEFRVEEGNIIFRV